MKQVAEFYHRDEISRTAPGVKDTKCIKDPKTEKVGRVPKQTMLYTLKEAYAILGQEFPNIQVGFTKFASLRPPDIELYSSRDQTSCCCPYCENAKFIICGVPWKNAVKPAIREIIKLITCDTTSSKCMFGDCDDCRNSVDNYLDQEI